MSQNIQAKKKKKNWKTLFLIHFPKHAALKKCYSPHQSEKSTLYSRQMCRYQLTGPDFLDDATVNSGQNSRSWKDGISHNDYYLIYICLDTSYVCYKKYAWPVWYINYMQKLHTASCAYVYINYKQTEMKIYLCKRKKVYLEGTAIEEVDHPIYLGSYTNQE